MAEHGFFNAADGYWQTLTDPSEETLAAYPEGTVEIPLKPGPDNAWDGAQWVATLVVVPVPETISDRQFYQQLAVYGLITQQEALAAVMTGALPATFETFIGQLPADQQFPARMSLSGATEFRRDHPLVAAFGAMQGMTSGQVDDLWRAAFALN